MAKKADTFFSNLHSLIDIVCGSFPKNNVGMNFFREGHLQRYRPYAKMADTLIFFCLHSN